MSTIEEQILTLNEVLLSAIDDADYFVCCTLDAPDSKDPSKSCQYLVVALNDVYVFKCTDEFKFDGSFISLTIKKTKEQLADFVINGLHKQQLLLDNRPMEFKDIRKVNAFMRLSKPTDLSTIIVENQSYCIITKFGRLYFEDVSSNPENTPLIISNAMCLGTSIEFIRLMASGTLQLKTIAERITGRFNRSVADILCSK